MKTRSGFIGVFAAGIIMSGPAIAAPKSAIPWLSDVLTRTEPVAIPTSTASDLTLTPIDVSPLSTDQSDGIGLLPGSITGLPQDLWQGMSALRARKRIAATKFGGMPSARALYRRVLLADAIAPVGTGASDRFILARIDRLLDIGAVRDAEALLDQIETGTPELFRRWFDIKLLSGRGDNACDRLRASPVLSPNRAVEIFCLARGGNWDAAMVTLDLSERLGDLPPDMAALIPFFLDPALIEGAEPPEDSGPVTPLKYVMLAGIGIPPSPETLPVAFAFSETTLTTPVRYRMDALERLTRKGLTDPAPLFAAYREEIPAASGGVWDRAKYVQRFDAATTGPDIAKALARLDQVLNPIGLRHAAAQEYRRKLRVLSPREVPKQAHDLIAAYLMLADDKATASRWITDDSADAIKHAFNLGQRQIVTARMTPEFNAIAEAFADTRTATPPDQVGEAILDALGVLAKPLPLAPHDLLTGLTHLRRAGQERAATAIAVETLLIPLEISYVDLLD